MKNNTLLLSTLAAAAVATGSATAGELTGSLSLDYNSHFISYGLDVWSGGPNQTDQSTFNPAVSFNYQVSDALSFNTGFWLDVNDNVAGSDFDTQETDTWFGVSYAKGKATYSATYQSWNYAGDTEEILDFAVALDTFLSPSLLIHVRTDAGAAVGGPAVGGAAAFEGTIAVLGASHSFDVTDKFSVTVPVSVGITFDAFHTSERGYAFTSVGLQSSYALTDAASFNAGITYYNTDEGVTGNANNNFITTNIGVSYSF